MIWYNNIELDYFENTLNKLIIKQSLTDVETLSNRKGTNSTTFDVPRTAHNEKALGYISKSGIITETKGTARIKIGGNIYSTGVIWVVGYDAKNFKLTFFGADIDLINSLKEKYVYELLENEGYDVYSYNDVNFKNRLGSIYTNGKLDMCMFNPLLSILDELSPDKLSLKTIAPHFKVKSIIEQILTGYKIESEFFTTEYHNHTFYSNFKGKHRPFNRSDGNIVTLTSTSPTIISIGNMSTETSNIIKSGNNYIINREVEELEIKLNANTNEECNIFICVYDSSGTIISQSISTKLLIGDNKINFKLEKTIPVNSYIIFRLTGNDGTVVTISDVEIYTDNIESTDYVALRDYAGELTQFEFLSNYLKHHNLVMDIENDTIYIDVQEDCLMHVSSAITNIKGLAKENLDISQRVSEIQDITIDYIQNNILSFEQKYISNSNVTDYAIQLTKQTFGGNIFALNSYKKGIESYSTEFNTYYDIVDSFNTPIAIAFYENWENILTCQVPLFGAPGDTFIDTYTNVDNSTTEVSVFWYTAKACRFDLITPKLFPKTIEQKKNNKIIETRLLDNFGEINFRKNYIINGQLFKLIEKEFDVITKECIIKLQLI